MLSILKRDWENVRKLSYEERLALWDSFVETCIVDDLRIKFCEYVYGKKIGVRFFYNATQTSEKQMIHEVIDVEKGSLFTVKVLYNEPSEDSGYLVQGREQTFHNVFREDYVTIAQIQCNKKMKFIFFEDYSEQIFVVS